MKTPEEIKKGLFHCGEDGCADCPYDDECDLTDHFTQIARDALAYIQQLEADLQREKDQHQYTIDAANVMKDEALKFESRLAQAERERDAAVEDLREASFCGDCFHYAVYAKNEPCGSCLMRGSEKPNWQWRGVCPENTKEET